MEHGARNEGPRGQRSGAATKTKYKFHGIPSSDRYQMITAIIINEAEIATRAHDLSNAGGTYWGRTGRVGSWRPQTVQIPFRYNGIVCHLIPFLPYSTPQVSIGRGSSPY